MKISTIFAVLVTSLVVFGCSSTKRVMEANPELEEMIANKDFKISVLTAEPLLTQSMAQIANSGLLAPGDNVNQRNVGGSGYFVKVVGDSASASLPYFGERQMGGGYGSSNGIEFNGLARDMYIRKTKNNNGYQVTFRAKDESEMYQVNMALYHNMSATLRINSSQRFSINYSGNVKTTEPEENK